MMMWHVSPEEEEEGREGGREEIESGEWSLIEGEEWKVHTIR